MSAHPSRRRLAHAGRIVPFLALLLAAVPVAPARGQAPLRPPAGSADAFQPDFVTRDLATIAEELMLDDAQRAELEAIFGQYSATFDEQRHAVRERIAGLRPGPRAPDEAYRRRQEEMRERMREVVDEARTAAAAAEDPEERRRILQAMRDELNVMRQELADFGATTGESEALREAMAKMEKITAEWIVRKDGLRRAMLESVQGLLTEEQKPRWPGLDRRLRREKTMHRSSLSGENVDLLRVLAEVGADPAAEPMRETALAYEVRLDGALRARNEHARRAIAGDATGATRGITLSRAVRDVVIEFTPLFAAALDPETGQLFIDTVNRRSLPRVYGPTRGSRLIAAAAGLPDLDETVRERVRGLEREVAAERAGLREQVRRVIFAEEPMQRRRELGGGDRPTGSDPVGDAYTRLREQDESAIQRLREIVGDEVFARLPGAMRGRRGGERDLESAGRAMQERLLRAYDVDGDGRLDEEERKAMRADRERGGGGG